MSTADSLITGEINKRPRDVVTLSLFSLVTCGAIVGLPTFAYFFDYSWVDWSMFVGVYIVTGLGMTVGYQR